MTCMIRDRWDAIVLLAPERRHPACAVELALTSIRVYADPLGPDDDAGAHWMGRYLYALAIVLAEACDEVQT